MTKPLASVPEDAEVRNPTTGEIGTPAEVAWPQPTQPGGVQVEEPPLGYEE